MFHSAVALETKEFLASSVLICGMDRSVTLLVLQELHELTKGKLWWFSWPGVSLASISINLHIRAWYLHKDSFGRATSWYKNLWLVPTFAPAIHLKAAI